MLDDKENEIKENIIDDNKTENILNSDTDDCKTETTAEEIKDHCNEPDQSAQGDEPVSGDIDKKGKKQSVFKEIISMVIYCAVILVIALIVVRFVGQRTEVIGDSMNPTLEDGNNLIVDKISYRFRDPQRFDIVVFPAPDAAEKNYIKRIIGMPGETIQIIDTDIYINGTILEEDYGAEPITYSGTATEPITLGPDEYFVMGDNRNNSKDSRYEVVGNIHRSELIGRAWLRIWPFKEFGFLKHQ